MKSTSAVFFSVSAFSLFLLSVWPLAAQKPTPVTTTPTAPSNSLPSTPGRTTSNLPTTTTPTPQIQRPVFISGKVIMEDGTPPPDLVKIERVCATATRGQGYTDHKGRFQFQLNGTNDNLPDASENSFPSFGAQSSSSSSSRAGGSEFAFSNCEIRAVLPGFRSNSLNLAMHSSFDNPDVGTIILHRMGGVEGSTISMTSLNAPKDAQKAFDKGRELLKKEKADDAEKNFRKAVDLYPNYATAWYELGRLQAARKGEDAEKSFDRAIAADSKFVSPYIELSMLAARTNDWKKTADLTARAIKLNGIDFPIAYFYNALALYSLGDLEPAAKSAASAVKTDTGHRLVKSEALLATILAGKGDLVGAAEHFRGYLTAHPEAPDAIQVRKQIALLDQELLSRKKE